MGPSNISFLSFQVIFHETMSMGERVNIIIQCSTDILDDAAWIICKPELEIGDSDRRFRATRVDRPVSSRNGEAMFKWMVLRWAKGNCIVQVGHIGYETLPFYGKVIVDCSV